MSTLLKSVRNFLKSPVLVVANREYGKQGGDENSLGDEIAYFGASDGLPVS
jgi:hypothetical protein